MASEQKITLKGKVHLSVHSREIKEIYLTETKGTHLIKARPTQQNKEPSLHLKEEHRQQRV